MVTSKKKSHDLNELVNSHDQVLSDKEEKVVRTLHGVKLSKTDQLKRKTDDEELLARLLELERTIIEKAKQKK